MPLSYVGRNPDSDSVIVPKTYADTTAAALAITPGYVNTQISTAITNNTLQTTGYVDTQDGLRAKKATVDAADANYLAASLLNAINGVAGVDVDGDLLSAQLPAGIMTDRVAACYTAQANGSVWLSSGSTHLVTTQNIREYLLGSITVPDPGYPYRVLPFAVVQGAALTPAPASRTVGNNLFGQLTVMPLSGSDQVYGMGICTDSNHYAYYPVLPYGATNQTPVSVPALNGGITLGLWGCCYYGNAYTFLGTGLQYWVLVVPAMGA